MTLIDIDPLKERIDKEVEEDKILSGWGFFFKSYLDSEPIFDIVRCKECKHRKKNGFCLEYNRYEKNDNGYCSYGEREDE